jgi:Glycosyl hydrolase family 76
LRCALIALEYYFISSVLLPSLAFCIFFSMFYRAIASPLSAAWLWRISILYLCISLCISSAIRIPTQSNEKQHVLSESTSPSDDVGAVAHPNVNVDVPSIDQRYDSLTAMVLALDVMQDQYFEVWQGIWPTGIDWTCAVLGTYISAVLNTLSMSYEYVVTPESTSPWKDNENLINRYFSQLIASYFGQDAFRLRNEAYDDMLWVVLGWLESIKFINAHSKLQYEVPQRPPLGANSKHSSWFGKQWIPAFAHRARLFWDFASAGWDTTLCGGGMLWSPYTSPYKNAITNELFITASISMYLYFPGDDNTSPFVETNGPPVGPRDPRYLAAAVQSYKWLHLSNMTNHKGLYIDGFHITGWEDHPKNKTQRNTKCDARNEMVYTYNQGVLLSGQRGLWEATGSRSFLEDGHKLISDVINATGYDLQHDKAYDGEKKPCKSDSCLSEWHGLGRSGILEDFCDAFGYCSQDGQTFKGIFFHHLTVFCAPLPADYIKPGEDSNVGPYEDDISWHDENCARYGKWIRRNAEAAMSTQDERGNYGMWWGAPASNQTIVLKPKPQLPGQAIDYRNLGVPRDEIWQRPGSYKNRGERTLKPLHIRGTRPRDSNDRGRGRTVETQGGGVMVLRALWEIVDLRALKKGT